MNAADYLDDTNTVAPVSPTVQLDANDFLDGSDGSQQGQSAYSGTNGVPQIGGQGGQNPPDQNDKKGQQTLAQWLSSRFSDQPGTHYDGLFPQSSDVDPQTGGASDNNRALAFPEIVRGGMRGLAELMAGAQGDTQQPITGASTLSPDALGTLAGLSPTSFAGASGSTLAPTLSAIKKTATGTGNAVSGLQEFLGNLSSGTADYPTTSQAMKQLANRYYQQASATGGTLNPAVTDAFVEAAQQQMPQTSEGLAVAGINPVSQLVDRLQALKGQPLSLQGAQEIDEHLGDLIDGEYEQGRVSKQGLRLQQIQNNLRDSIYNAAPDDVEGGAAGFNALAQGRQAWSQASKMSDVERILTRAQYSQVPATALQTGFRTMLSNPARLRGYSPDEIDAIKDAATTGMGTGALKIAGSRLIPLMAGAAGMGTGGVEGAAVHGALAGGVSTAARNLASKIQTGKAMNVLDVLGQNAPPGFVPLGVQ